MIRTRLTAAFFSLLLLFATPASMVAAEATPTGTDSSASTSQTTESAPAPSPTSTTSAEPSTAGTTSSSTTAPSDSTSTASSPTPTATSTTATADTTGPTQPPGDAGSTYVYNPATGLWENDYYTWNPVTKQTAPKTPQEYSYNPATGKWDTTEWVYDAPSGKYVPNVVSVDSNPTPIQTAQITDTGPASTNTVGSNTQNSGIFDLFYDAKVSNNIDSMAASGNALVQGNTYAGSALSGNAVTIANIINLLQSTWGLQPSSDIVTFQADINGNVTGDLYIDPGLINTGPLSVNNTNNNTDNNLTINVNGSGLIDNTVNVGATSGSATVSSNTNAGSATSGNANAVANLVNVINSAILANKSFLGVLNINGNLNGDILLPKNFLDQLIASNAPNATINMASLNQANVVASLNNNQTINNAVNLGATSGTATVSGNTNAGSATTGAAATNLTIFNLTGRQVIGTNSLLVFVNVLGKWVGLILDAPAGSTAAAYCGGSCTVTKSAATNATVTANTNQTINNNVTVAAQSGNAGVVNNTNAGSAKSGDATASANIMNVEGSQFSLGGWLGMLFINVFGTWTGSFGINTSAGTVHKSVKPSAEPAQVGGVFKFVPKEIGIQIGAVVQSIGAEPQQPTANKDKHLVAAASTGKTLPPASAVKQAVAAAAAHQRSWLMPSIAVATTLLLFMVAGSYELLDKIRMNALAFRLNHRIN